jgi:hypothetical protein
MDGCAIRCRRNRDDFLWRSAWCILWLVGTIAALMAGAVILTHALTYGWNHAHGPRITGVMMV